MTLINKKIFSLFCLAVFLFMPIISYGQSGPNTSYEQDEVWEAVSFAVETSDCAEGAHDATGYASIFRSRLAKNGYAVKYVNNTDVDYYDFTDSTIWDDGQDDVEPDGTDWADAIFIATHGFVDRGEGDSCFLMGKDHGEEDNYGGDTCYVTTRSRHTPLWPFSENPWNTTKLSAEDSVSWGPWMDFLRFYWPFLFFFIPHPGHISWGDVDANAVATIACHSCAFSVWENHGYKPGEFSREQFNMYAGFHGTHSITYPAGEDKTTFRDLYMKYSIEKGIGQWWVNYMSTKIGYGETWNCATVVTYGKNYEERLNFFYNAGWKNFLDTGRRGRGSTYWAIAGCNPANAEEIDPMKICPQY